MKNIARLFKSLFFVEFIQKSHFASSSSIVKLFRICYNSMLRIEVGLKVDKFAKNLIKFNLDL